MSEDNQSAKASKTGWTAVQVYTLSAICLLIGITMGFLIRGSSTPTKGSSGDSASGIPTSASTPSADDMKRMAEKQVAPLLEQLKNDPNNVELLGKVAHYYMVASQYNDAVPYYEKVAQVKPSAEALTNLANAYAYGGSSDKAIENLNRALQIDPNAQNALYNLGMLRWEVQSDTKGAIECWEKLLKTKLTDQQRAQVEQMIAKAKEHSQNAPGTQTDKPAM